MVLNWFRDRGMGIHLKVRNEELGIRNWFVSNKWNYEVIYKIVVVVFGVVCGADGVGVGVSVWAGEGV